MGYSRSATEDGKRFSQTSKCIAEGRGDGKMGGGSRAVTGEGGGGER